MVTQEELDSSHRTGTPKDLYSDYTGAITMVCFSFQLSQNADSVQGFWDIILKGESAMTEVPGDRWNIDDTILLIRSSLVL
jgi:hypothetical protein